jgi:hypothetical protein
MEPRTTSSAPEQEPEPPTQAQTQTQTGTETDQPAGELDLLAIGLLVFFVSLILIVGALLILPAIV